MSKTNPNQRTFLGMPMCWDAKYPFRAMWNKGDDRLFPPKSFGIGWTINLHAVLRKIGVIKPDSEKK